MKKAAYFLFLTALLSGCLPEGGTGEGAAVQTGKGDEPSVTARKVPGMVAEATNVIKVLCPEPIYSRISADFAAKFPRQHLTRGKLDDEVARRALDLYLGSLDYDHTYFLASDIEEFGKQVSTFDDKLRAGDIVIAYEIFETFKKRVRDRFQYVKKALDKGFIFSKEESYGWKRRDAPWPANKAEQDELWRKKIKNEFLGRKIALEFTPRDDKEAEEDDSLLLDPMEWVLQRYTQYLGVLEDHDAVWVFEKYMRAFAQAYDPHSDYMSPNAVEDFDIEMKLSLTGIGAALKAEDGAAKIVRIIPGGPAERDGRLKRDDKIIGVGQGDDELVDTRHWPLYKAVRIIRGPKGSEVVLVIMPASGGATTKIRLTRDEVKLEDQAATSRTQTIKGPNGKDLKFGVVSLPAFYADLRGKSRGATDYRSASRDVEKILNNMKKENISGLVLDLRNNGGGSLLEAIDMAGLFIDYGPVVQVKERGITTLSDDDPRVVYGGPMIVLVNRLSASASEILAGALKDYGRAVVVGDSQTHGKGTVQSVVRLHRLHKKFGSLRVTTASFYRVAGGSTQRKGVASDIVIPSAFDTMEVSEEYLPYALPWSRTLPVRFRRVGDLDMLIKKLITNSETRRTDDPRFAARNELLKRLTAVQKAKEISLNLKQRRVRATEERELRELQEQDAVTGDGEEKSDGDLILQESLKILADMISINLGSQQNAAASE